MQCYPGTGLVNVFRTGVVNFRESSQLQPHRSAPLGTQAFEALEESVFAFLVDGMASNWKSYLPVGELPMPANYRIGEFAELSGVSAKTLRFYDEIGLFRPAATDSRTRYRHYRPHQLEELASILALKSLGVPLHEI